MIGQYLKQWEIREINSIFGYFWDEDGTAYWNYIEAAIWNTGPAKQ